MFRKCMKAFVLVGALALLPSLAAAWSGILVQCTPSLGQKSTCYVKPGFNCDVTYNKLSLSATMDGCVANPSPPWDEWAAAKLGSKITAAAAASIAKAVITMKGVTYGTCDFAADPNDSYWASTFASYATGSVTYLTSADEKVAGGSLKYFANVSGDLVTASAMLVGMVTKGLGVGGELYALVAFDLSDPRNNDVLLCNTNYGLACEGGNNVFSDGWTTELALTTTSSSVIQVSFPVNDDCVGPRDPYACCTGAGTGACGG